MSCSLASMETGDLLLIMRHRKLVPPQEKATSEDRSLTLFHAFHARNASVRSGWKQPGLPLRHVGRARVEPDFPDQRPRLWV